MITFAKGCTPDWACQVEKKGCIVLIKKRLKWWGVFGWLLVLLLFVCFLLGYFCLFSFF